MKGYVMQILIETNDPYITLADDLPENIEKQFVSFDITRTDSLIEQMFKIIFNIPFDVGIGLLSTWLYNKIKNNPDNITRIEGKKLNSYSEEAIRIIIENIVQNKNKEEE
jgi:hypothetical protein